MEKFRVDMEFLETILKEIKDCYEKFKENKNGDKVFTLYLGILEERRLNLFSPILEFLEIEKIPSKILYGNYSQRNKVSVISAFSSSAFIKEKNEICDEENWENLEKILEKNPDIIRDKRTKPEYVQFIDLSKKDGIIEILDMITVDFSLHSFSNLNEENSITNLLKSKNSYICFNSLIKREMEKLLSKIDIQKILVFSGHTYIKLSNEKNNKDFKIKKYFEGEKFRGKVKNYYSKTYNSSDLFEKYHEIFEVVNYQNYPIEDIEDNFFDIRGSYFLRGVRKEKEEEKNIEYNEYRGVNLKDLKDFFLNIEEVEKVKLEKNTKKINEYKIKKYDILYSIRGNFFRTVIVLDEVPDDLISSDNVGILRIKNKEIDERSLHKIYGLFKFLQRKDLTIGGGFRVSLKGLKIPKYEMMRQEDNFKEEIEKSLETIKQENRNFKEKLNKVLEHQRGLKKSIEELEALIEEN